MLSRPGEPRLRVRLTWLCTVRRMPMAQVCQPLAIRPPKKLCLAAAGSTWKGCGSYLLANSMISSSANVCLPISMRSPGLKSSQYIMFAALDIRLRLQFLEALDAAAQVLGQRRGLHALRV